MSTAIKPLLSSMFARRQTLAPKPVLHITLDRNVQSTLATSPIVGELHFLTLTISFAQKGSNGPLQGAVRSQPSAALIAKSPSVIIEDSLESLIGLGRYSTGCHFLQSRGWFGYKSVRFGSDCIVSVSFGSVRLVPRSKTLA
jgi:hypothetical protein